MSLKPSGIPWLGDIPEHWEVVTLRHRYIQCLGKMLDSKKITGKYLVPYLRNTDVQWDRIDIDDLPLMDIKHSEYDRYTVQNGDLLVCEGGEVGRCAIWNGAIDICGFQKALHRLRPIVQSKDMPRFMLYELHAATKGKAFDDGRISTIQHLTGEKIRAHRFAFPTFNEQYDIAIHLDNETSQINKAIASLNHVIELLREYRTRLVVDVVTGKLDVREVAAKLPEEEPLEETETSSEDEISDEEIAV